MSDAQKDPQIIPLGSGHKGLKGIVHAVGRKDQSDTQAEDVANYYRDELHIDPIVEQSEWCRISGRKQG